MVRAGRNRNRELFHCPLQKPKEKDIWEFCLHSFHISSLLSQLQITSPSSVPTSLTSSPRTGTLLTRSQCRNPAICTSEPPVLHVSQGNTCSTVLLARSYQGKQTQICPGERLQLQINMKLGSRNCCMEQSKPLFLASSTSNFCLHALSAQDQRYWCNPLRRSLKKIQPLLYDEGRCLDLRTQTLLEREKIKGSLTVPTYQKQTNEPPVHRTTLLFISEPGQPFVLRTLNNKSKNKQKEPFPPAQSKF